MRRTAFRRILLGNPWRHNGTWTLSGTVWTNTPILGGELLSNVEFATDTSGWTSGGSATLTRRDYSSSPIIAPTGGADNFGLEIASTGTITASASQNVVSTVGLWYLATCRAYSPSANTVVSPANLRLAGAIQAINDIPSEDAWQMLASVARASTTTMTHQPRCTSATSGDLAHFDKMSLTSLLLTQLLVLRRIGGTPTVTGKPTLGGATPCGVCAKVDDLINPQNGIFCYHNRANVVMDKLVAGTWTNLISTAVTYSAGATIEIRPNGTNIWQAWYNGSQRGTDQTISDASIVNNALYGGFSTYSGNTINSLAVS